MLDSLLLFLLLWYFCEIYIFDKIKYWELIEYGFRLVYLNVWNDVMCEVCKVNWLIIIKKV